MPQKLRKGKDRRRARSQKLAREAIERDMPQPPSSKQTPVAKAGLRTDVLSERNRYVLSEIRRSLMVAGVVLVVLIILALLLR